MAPKKASSKKGSAVKKVIKKAPKKVVSKSKSPKKASKVAKKSKSPKKAVKKSSPTPKVAKKSPAPKTSSPKKRKSKKSKEGKPKRAMSAFMMFANANRAKVIQSLGLQPRDIGPIGKALGEMWGKMSPADKKPYEAMADKDRARYEKEKKAAGL